ncbi:MAG: DUF1634 domain-containing protein [Chloroflexi bacterium]|uniref:DUF1634 domain-containing protein n=1 Tax=Candidatus Chlorohelix allophototropha TaxID=3003348 RepID=A0A8T7M4I5_9CHLR|nr:DUF1634 domain-containing protein [Chloroflexota bacterium]WJW70003.1 DUF1634 domain-containing protein [Chloroflexota bacterium L227-S17]
MKTDSGEKRAEIPPPKGNLFSAALSVVLRAGVILSAIVISLGLCLFLVTGKSGYAYDDLNPNDGGRYMTLENTSAEYFPSTPQKIWEGVLTLKPFAIITLGLIFLILTPVVNVALAALMFIRSRDLAFSLISLFVLFVLVFSFFLGKAGG